MNVGLALLLAYLLLLTVVLVVHAVVLPSDNTTRADAEQVAAITRQVTR